MSVCFYFWLRSRQNSQSRTTPGTLPPAAVLIAARGLDPTFVRMLESVSRLEYPDYEIVIAADEMPDWGPSWLPEWKPVAVSGQSNAGDSEILELVSERVGAPRIRIVRRFRKIPTCGLKCSALIAAWNTISNRVEVCAFLDTDVVPGPGWLADLVAQAMVPDCGSASGVQWYEPPDYRAGSLIRSLWNAAAVFPIAIFGNPWAGSMAIRRDVIERSGLVDRWAHSIVDDGPVRQAVNSIGLKTRFVPSLVMVNRESCDAGYAINWIGRMVKWSSIFDPDFRNTLVHAIISSILFLLAVVTVLWGAVTGSGGWWWPLAGLFAGCFFYVAGWFTMRQASVAGRTEKNATGSPVNLALVMIWGLFLVLVTQTAFCFQTFRALVARRYVWRGIVYDVSPDGIVSFDSAGVNPGRGKC